MFETIPPNLYPWLIGAVIMIVVWVKYYYSYFKKRSPFSFALASTAFFLSIANLSFFLPVLFVDNLYDYTFIYVVGQHIGMIGFFWSAIWMCLLVFSKRWETAVFLSGYALVIATYIVFNAWDLLDRGLSIEPDGNLNFYSRQELGAYANAVLLVPFFVVGINFLVRSRAAEGYVRLRLMMNGTLLTLIMLSTVPDTLTLADENVADEFSALKLGAMGLFLASTVIALVYHGRHARSRLDNHD